MRLFLIRHGQSHNNLVHFQSTTHEEYVRDRLPDPDLTPLGQRQAEAVAKHVATAMTVEHFTGYGWFDGSGYEITRLFCSPMRRAMQTAQPIAKAIGVSPQIDVDIYEFGGMHIGDMRKPETCMNHAGMTATEIAQEVPGYVIPDSITEDGWYSGGSEGRAAFDARIKRVAAFLHEMAAESNRQYDSHEHVALVVHADFIHHLLKELIGQSEQSDIWYLLNNTSITLLEFTSTGSIRIGYVNRSEHLTADVFAEPN